MINKKTVANNFSKSSKNYDKFAKVQKYMSEKLIAYLDEDKYTDILEIGCGTGILTDRLLTKYPECTMDLCDISFEMLKKVEEKYKNKINKYILGDIEELEIDKKYDLIISNASFQWFSHLDRTLEKLKNHLNEGGLLIFSTFGDGTYKELIESFRMVGDGYVYSQDFASADFFINRGYELYEEVYKEDYTSLSAFLRAIKGVGASSARENKKPLTKSILYRAEEEYRKLCGGKVEVTNHLMYILFKNR